MFYSIIVPVYNRPDEVTELLESLSMQEGNIPFEVLIVEDTAELPSDKVAEKYQSRLTVRYFSMPDTDRSFRRNYGMQQSKGDYFLFFDSDCIIPPKYFINLDKALNENYSDCFGGPDSAHASFSNVQKAINYAMTSFFTTGGIRGGKQQMEKFKPRTFNMGFSKEVFIKAGGFNNMFGEDIDLSIRIANAGFKTQLCREAFVYHKRRVSFKKFFKQIHNFGVARINLALLHKGSLKLVHTLPALMLVAGILWLLFMVYNLLFATRYSVLVVICFLLPIAYALLLFGDALFATRNGKVALLAVWASCIQTLAYGWGFLKSFVQKIIFRQNLEDSATLKRIYN